MNNIPALFRSFIIYAACVVLAIWLGFLLATPLTYSQLFIYGVLAFILIFPVLLRWHYPLLVLSWYMYASVFFLPGQPAVVLPMIVLSLGISIVQQTISHESRFIRVPQITLPLLFMLAMIVITARLTGFGLRVFGSATYGANKYFYLVGGILGYFALSARRIPLERKNLYVGLFFLGGVVGVIGDLLPLLPHSFYFIYLVFRPNTNFLRSGGINSEETRLGGTWLMSMAVLSYMLARYGIRGMFLSGKPWRWILFSLFAIAGLFGGFRGFIILIGLNFVSQFFLEGLHRTKLMPIFLFAGVFGAMALIPLAEHLPYTFQRAISFLPYKVSTAARMDAQASLDWRVQIWQAILPQVPKCLLLGKGYVLSPLDYEFSRGPEGSFRSATFAQNDPLALSEDFHNGPLTIIIPFGIWGCIVFLWFIIAAMRVLYLNYHYSDPALQLINTALLSAFITQTFFFLFVGGGFNSDMLKFCGLIGLSVALNGGVRQPVRAVQTITVKGKSQSIPKMPPSPVPAFHRHR
jgi:hypothetical protein